LIATPRSDSTAIVTDTWDGDRYLHLALQETGYHALATDEATEACSKSAEIFGKGRRRVLHVRLHQPFLRNWPQFAAARLKTWGEPCILGWKPERLLRLAPIWQLREPTAVRAGSAARAARERALATMAATRYSPQVALEVAVSDLDSLYQGYLSEIPYEELRSASARTPTESLRDAERLMAARVWTSRSSAP
jgi:hypothetical protein